MERNFIGYNTMVEYKVDVSYRAYKHFITSQKLFIEGEDDTCIKVRSNASPATQILCKADLLIGYEYEPAKVADLIRQAIRKNFNEKYFNFRLHVAVKDKEYKMGNFIISITKCEIQRIREEQWQQS